jgi:hypothetical protein
MGCAGGFEAGVLPGCAAGYGFGAMAHATIFNYVESIFSTVSFFTTMRSDVMTQDTKLDPSHPTTWQLGEDTVTGFYTWLPGTLAVEPFIDAGFDVYASGYNHGLFCGISTILDC